MFAIIIPSRDISLTYFFQATPIPIPRVSRFLKINLEFSWEGSRCTWHRFLRIVFFTLLAPWKLATMMAVYPLPEIALPFREFPRKRAQSPLRQKMFGYNARHLIVLRHHWTHPHRTTIWLANERFTTSNPEHGLMLRDQSVPISSIFKNHELCN